MKSGVIAGVGSSSIQKWKMETTFEKIGYSNLSNILNFGKSGATIQKLNANLEYISSVIQAKPDVIIFYGANDLKNKFDWSGQNGNIVKNTYANTVMLLEKICAGTKKLTGKVPQVLYVSVVKTPGTYKMCATRKPSCNIWDRMDSLNEQMREYAEKTSHVTFVDIQQEVEFKEGGKRLMFYLDDSGVTSNAKDIIAAKTTCAYFQKDLQHFSPKGYDRFWTPVAKLAVEKL